MLGIPGPQKFVEGQVYSTEADCLPGTWTPMGMTDMYLWACECHVERRTYVTAGIAREPTIKVATQESRIAWMPDRIPGKTMYFQRVHHKGLGQAYHRRALSTNGQSTKKMKSTLYSAHILGTLRQETMASDHQDLWMFGQQMTPLPQTLMLDGHLGRRSKKTKLGRKKKINNKNVYK